MRTLKNKTSVKTFISDESDAFFETQFSDEIETRFVFPNIKSYQINLDDIIEAAKEHKKFLGKLRYESHAWRHSIE